MFKFFIASILVIKWVCHGSENGGSVAIAARLCRMSMQAADGSTVGGGSAFVQGRPAIKLEPDQIDAYDVNLLSSPCKPVGKPHKTFSDGCWHGC
jgi:hypothetical protein